MLPTLESHQNPYWWSCVQFSNLHGAEGQWWQHIIDHAICSFLFVDIRCSYDCAKNNDPNSGEEWLLTGQYHPLITRESRHVARPLKVRMDAVLGAHAFSLRRITSEQQCTPISVELRPWHLEVCTSDQWHHDSCVDPIVQHLPRHGRCHLALSKSLSEYPGGGNPTYEDYNSTSNG